MYRRVWFRDQKILNFVSALIREMISEDSLILCLSFPGKSAPAPRDPFLTPFISHIYSEHFFMPCTLPGAGHATVSGTHCLPPGRSQSEERYWERKANTTPVGKCYNQGRPRAIRAPNPALGNSGKLMQRHLTSKPKEEIQHINLAYYFHAHYYGVLYTSVIILLVLLQV